MPKYTNQEIREDIRMIEGVDLEIPDNLIGGVLYSNVNARPMSGNSTVAQLQERVHQYFRENCYPQLDKDPDPNPGMISVYAIVADPPWSMDLGQSTSKFLLSYHVRNDKDFGELLDQTNYHTLIQVDNDWTLVGAATRTLDA